MKKILALLSFVVGAVFGLLFSTKKGEEIRSELKKKSDSEGKLKVLGTEAKSALTSFWKVIKGPLEKAFQTIEKEAGQRGKKYGRAAKAKIIDLKNKAMKEIEKDVKFARKKLTGRE